MKKNLTIKNVLLVILLTLSFTAFSNPVDVNTAQQIGKNFLKHSVSTYANMRSDFNCDLIYTLQNDNGEPVLFVFNVANTGFVIVSAENSVSPILGYSTEGTFDNNNISPEAAYVLTDYKATIDYVRAQKISASEEVQEQWNLVATEGRVTKERNGKSVPALCTTTWNQNKYYNRLCPADAGGPDGHVYAGCVATAMAQVIKFWDYPATGSGSHTYTPSGYPTQTANFGATNYNFGLMPNKLDSTSTELQINTVARLIWHCGIGVNMMYTNHGSGAYSDDVPDVLINNFLYQNSLNIQYRSSNWDNQLRNNIDGGMPIYYSGQDPYAGAGHAFVCDGYDNNNMFHFNFGWSGLDNGYYPSNAINTTHGPYYFNTSQAAIFNIAPNSNYINKAAAPSNLVVTPAPNYGLSATISWNNPYITMSADTLTSITSIIIKRNNVIIATLENPIAGDSMSYVDATIPELGSYSYSIYAVTDNGDGLSASTSIYIGPTCDITIHMHDSYGDGWNNASISIRNAANVVLATAALSSGSDQTVTYPIPSGAVKFYWVHGNYDSECSFQIYNASDNQIYASSGTPQSGLFFTYTNQCQTDIQGDANSDSAVNTADVMAIVAYMLNQSPRPFVFANADINADGIIDIRDITLLCNIILNQ